MLPLIKMFFAITVGELDDHTNIRSVIFLSKGIYVITGILFFFAGVDKSLLLLLCAVVSNAF